ncbi:MAG TPA: ATP-binding protein [Bryobacteraceae bacterium]|nr:ATP-binding protein [Bryobacteraceae bacterium]
MAQSALLTGVEFTLDGNLPELERLADEVAWFCEENALGSEAEFDLNLALEELFTNAIRHGGCEGMKNAVRIRLERSGDLLAAEFADRGREFDPATAPAPDVSANLAGRPPGGLGLHLVRSVMSDVQYQRRGDWNWITMRRPA